MTACLHKNYENRFLAGLSLPYEYTMQRFRFFWYEEVVRSYMYYVSVLEPLILLLQHHGRRHRANRCSQNSAINEGSAGGVLWHKNGFQTKDC